MKPFLYAQFYDKKGKHIEELELFIRRDNSEEDNKEKKNKEVGFKIENDDKKAG